MTGLSRRISRRAAELDDQARRFYRALMSALCDGPMTARQWTVLRHGLRRGLNEIDGPTAAALRERLETIATSAELRQWLDDSKALDPESFDGRILDE